MVNIGIGKNSTVGARLLEERQRLKLSQTQLAERGGVSKFTQLNYEKGESSPNADYLHQVAAAGVDMVYVLTGERVGAPQHSETWIGNDGAAGGRRQVFLDERLQLLILKFERADEVGKGYIEGLASLAAGEGNGARSPSAGEVALAGQLSRAADAVAGDKDDPTLWRAVARGLQTAPNANSQTHLSVAQWLDIVDQAYAIELAKQASAPARPATKLRRKVTSPK